MPRQKHNDTKDPAEDVCSRPNCGHVRRKHHRGATKPHDCIGRHYDAFSNSTTTCKCTEFREPRKPTKPRKDTVSMQARWHGEPPKVGEYLRSNGPGTRYAYRIASIVRLGQLNMYVIEAHRIETSAVPLNAMIHVWKWDSRDRTKERTGAGWQ